LLVAKRVAQLVHRDWVISFAAVLSGGCLLLRRLLCAWVVRAVDKADDERVMIDDMKMNDDYDD
jgi:hypothetical protein